MGRSLGLVCWLATVLVLAALVGDWPFFHGGAAEHGRFGVVSLVVVVPALVSMIGLHEAGHAAVARILGFHVGGVLVGMGREVWSFTVGRTPWVVRAVPIGGATFLATTERRWYVPRIVAAVAAGPVATALVLALAVAWDPGAAQLVWARNVLIAMVVLQLVADIVPSRCAPGGGWNDGGTIVLALAKPHDSFERQRVDAPTLDVHAHLARGDVGRARAALAERAQEGAGRPDGVDAIGEAHLLLAAGDPRGAYEMLRDAEPSVGVLDGTAAAHVANLAAYAALCCDDRDLIPDADRWSAHAYAVLPAAVAVIDTRGWALVETGRFAAGRQLLQQAGEKTSGDDAVNVRAHLLCAAVASGDLLRARDMAANLPVAAGGDPSVAIALRRYRAAVDALSDEQRDLLRRTGPGGRAVLRRSDVV